MNIGLFIPCYVDALYPEVGVSTFRLLKSLGLNVDYPLKQTCCGQPMGNAGFEKMAVPLVKNYAELFHNYDYVVTPSASCAAYVRFFHENIVEGDRHVCEAAGKTTDLVEFLHDIIKIRTLPSVFPYKVSVHNSCHGVRELGLSTPSERNLPHYNKIINLLNLVDGITIVEPDRKDECCGFGGMFSIEEKAVSTQMGKDKLRRHEETGAQYVTGSDSSCLMHLQGIAKKQGSALNFIHVAQILSAGL